MPRLAVSLIAAVARDGGIGRAGDLLVRLPGDLPRFRRITLGAPVVMGRKTFDSIGRALPGRRNIVVTRNRSFAREDVETVASFDEALALAAGAPRAYVIGGADIYALALPLADELLLTEIDAAFPADAYFPAWDRRAFTLAGHEPHLTDAGVRYSYATYRRSTQEERAP
ncbi:MAG: dihydrofolate reductase [Caldimonas sp.]